jgi:predicted aconitase with swiveling domain
MTTLKGKTMLGGRASGPALVTRMPLNVTASFSGPANLLPTRRAEVRDRLHELFGKNIQGKVLIFPACIGSTFTGMVLMQLMKDGHAPAAVIVQNADSLLVSGAVLAEVWFKKGIPVIEYQADDIYEQIKTGDQVEVNGDAGEIIFKDGS